MAANRSADSAYYRAKQPLKLNMLREGRKNARPNPSYRSRMNDATTSSNKYYLEMQGNKPESPAVPVKEVAQAVKAPKEVSLRASTRALGKIIDAFADDATSVVIAGKANAVSKVQTSVDLAVGRGDLTRAQADSVKFSVEEAAPKKSKKKEKGAVGVKGEPGEVGEPGKVLGCLNDELADDVDAVINSDPGPAPVDEGDIASLFGLNDSDDSDD